MTARLAQYTLTYAAFTQLTTVRTLVDGQPDPAAQRDPATSGRSSSRSASSACTQPGSRPRPSRASSSARTSSSCPQRGREPRTCRAWRATPSARQAWEQTLQARVEEQRTVIAAAAANADAAEGATLTQLRDARVLATDAPGTTLKAMADWLTISLMIDAETGGSMKTTRIEQAIETLQDIMIGVRNGLIGDFELALSSAPAAISFVAGSSRYDVFAQRPRQRAVAQVVGHDLERMGIARRHPHVRPGGHHRRLNGRADVFVRGADGAVWHLPYSGGAGAAGIRWAASWPRAPPPAAASRRSESIDVFVVGSDGRLWQSSGSVGGQDPTVGPWLQVARTGTAARPAGSPRRRRWWHRTPATTTCSSRAATTKLWHDHYDGTAWSGWALAGRALASGPSAAIVGGPLAGVRPPRRRHDLEPDRPRNGWRMDLARRLRPVTAPARWPDNIFIASTAGVLEHKWRGRLPGWHGWETTSGAHACTLQQLRRRVDLDGLLRHLARRHHGLPLPGDCCSTGTLPRAADARLPDADTEFQQGPALTTSQASSWPARTTATSATSARSRSRPHAR